MVAYTFKPSPWWARVSGSLGVQDQPYLYSKVEVQSETLLQNSNNKPTIRTKQKNHKTCNPNTTLALPHKHVCISSLYNRRVCVSSHYIVGQVSLKLVVVLMHLPPSAGITTMPTCSGQFIFICSSY